MRRIATALIIIAFTPVTMAAIINIPTDYPTIQQGIDAGADNDTVLVQPGTYYENINFNGHNIVVGSLFLTTGDESYLASTVIDGDSSGAVITLSNFESSSAVISGFTIIDGGGVQGGGVICDGSGPIITHNFITQNVGEFGGGVYCTGADPIISENRFFANFSSGIGCFRSRPKIIGNILMGNTAELGGAIYCENSPGAFISDNYITRNFGLLDGAGIYCNLSDATITGNLITENMAGRGAGIYCQQSSPSITGNTVNYNQGEINGGGFYLDHSDPIMGNNIIAGNLAISYGAGMFLNQSNPHFINNTVAENAANLRGGGIYLFYSQPVITNTILWANRAPSHPEIFDYSGPFEISYSDIEGGWPGTGNIDIDPLFKYPSDGDYQLMAIECGDTLDSPCIDTGDPDILDSLLDCSWGLGSAYSDMGAYGGGDSVTLGIFEGSSSLPVGYALLKNYPNPFNARTTIEFSLPKESEIELIIYDLLGREVAVLEKGLKSAGKYEIPFNATGLSSGVYFYSLQAANEVEIRKMVLLK